MFTGIIKKTARVITTEKRGKSLIVHIEKSRSYTLNIGESISVAGVCSTVRAQGATYFEVEYMPATIAITTMGALKEGSVVNLERSMRLIDMVNGHFVQGHVDATATVRSIEKEGDALRITFEVPTTARKLLVPWGSVTVDGVSLTVQALSKRTFTVALISHTLQGTTLSRLRKGDRVNIETDMFARYLAELLKK